MEGAAVLVSDDPPLKLSQESDADRSPSPDSSLPLGDAAECPDSDETGCGPAPALSDAATVADAVSEFGDIPSVAPESDSGANATETITPVQIVEAILFASDTPLPGAKVAQALGVGDARDVRRHVTALNEKYAQIGATFRIQEIGGGYLMLTLPIFNTWLAKLHKARQETRLSAAAMETLAVVAYKQPVTRAEIESIRGVAAGEVLNRLRELDLVKIAGRAEDLGRPLLYGTTKRFLEVFGLGGLDDLPKIEDTMFASKAPPAPTGEMKGAGAERPADMPAPAVPLDEAAAHGTANDEGGSSGGAGDAAADAPA